MIAIQYRKSIPRYLMLRTLGPRLPTLYTGPLATIALCDVPEPPLPTPQWVAIEPLLSGICGSDLATIRARGSPYLSPLTSTPFVLGHEVVGRISQVGEEAGDIEMGRRVVVEPALGCTVRGIEDVCAACRQGQAALCRNVTAGDIAPGIQTGYCRDTGGGWSRRLVAHRSQVYAVPDTLDDDVAVLAEPLACALHGVLRAEELLQETSSAARPRAILVVGCGAMGLLTIAALRGLGIAGRVIALGKHRHQRDLACQLGADEALPFERDVVARYELLSAALDADVHQPEIGKPTVCGGADLTFDCVASSTSIDDACRFTTAGGTVVLVGMPAIPRNIDWTAIWYKQLSLRAAYAYGTETCNGRQRSTFDWTLELLGGCGAELRALVGPPFALQQYRAALNSAMNAGRSRTVKTLFRIE